MLRQVKLGGGRDEDVRRLDVAMDEPGGVRSVERAGDRRQQFDRAGRFEQALLAQVTSIVSPAFASLPFSTLSMATLAV